MFAGAEVFEVAMTTLDPTVKVTLEASDGDRFEAGAVLARSKGPLVRSCRPSGSRSTSCNA